MNCNDLNIGISIVYNKAFVIRTVALEMSVISSFTYDVQCTIL